MLRKDRTLLQGGRMACILSVHQADRKDRNRLQLQLLPRTCFQARISTNVTTKVFIDKKSSGFTLGRIRAEC